MCVCVGGVFGCVCVGVGGGGGEEGLCVCVCVWGGGLHVCVRACVRASVRAFNTTDIGRLDHKIIAYNYYFKCDA